MCQTSKCQGGRPHSQQMTTCGKSKARLNSFVAFMWGSLQRNWASPLAVYRISCTKIWGAERHVLVGYPGTCLTKAMRMEFCRVLNAIWCGYVAFLHRIVTEKEKWEGMETLLISPYKKLKIMPPAKKVMVKFFWGHHGVLLVDFLTLGTTVNATSYSVTLDQMRKVLCL